MAASELTIELIHEYLIKFNGVVTNREAVKYFKRYLTDPASKDDARAKFKKYVNTLATTRSEGDEKFLVLKPKYQQNMRPTKDPPPPPVPYGRPPGPAPLSPLNDPRICIGIPSTPPSNNVVPDYSSPSQSPGRLPPPYRPPPPVTSPSPSIDTLSLSSMSSFNEVDVPTVPPRRRSQDKLVPTKGADTEVKNSVEPVYEDQVPSETEEKPTVSVKERTQKFNRLASVDNELSPSPQGKEKSQKKEKGADEDDGAALASMLEPKKCTEWWVTASKADYQELCKLAKAEPRLAKLKDPFTTVLHWAAKHGNADIVKLFAGSYKCDVNAKTGYTPLHLAAQFGHDQLFNLLVEVYKADINIRDFNGRFPTFYKNQGKSQIGSKDTYRKMKARKKISEKDLGFLRIGSLNVRVKKTTEAFSNFLGVVSAGSIIPVDSMSEKVHKSWGSADNLAKENAMPAPKTFIMKKKSKRNMEVQSASTPGTPNQNRISKINSTMPDSDSDTACGFDSNWSH